MKLLYKKYDYPVLMSHWWPLVEKKYVSWVMTHISFQPMATIGWKEICVMSHDTYFFSTNGHRLLPNDGSNDSPNEVRLLNMSLGR